MEVELKLYDRSYDILSRITIFSRISHNIVLSKRLRWFMRELSAPSFKNPGFKYMNEKQTNYTMPATISQPPTKVIYFQQQNVIIVRTGIDERDFTFEEAIEFAFSIVRLAIDFGGVEVEKKVGVEWQRILLSSSGMEKESGNLSGM